MRESVSQNQKQLQQQRDELQSQAESLKEREKRIAADRDAVHQAVADVRAFQEVNQTELSSRKTAQTQGPSKS